MSNTNNKKRREVTAHDREYIDAINSCDCTMCALARQNLIFYYRGEDGEKHTTNNYPAIISQLETTANLFTVFLSEVHDSIVGMAPELKIAEMLMGVKSATFESTYMKHVSLIEQFSAMLNATAAISNVIDILQHDPNNPNPAPDDDKGVSQTPMEKENIADTLSNVFNSMRGGKAND